MDLSLVMSSVIPLWVHTDGVGKGPRFSITRELLCFHTLAEVCRCLLDQFSPESHSSTMHGGDSSLDLLLIERSCKYPFSPLQSTRGL